MLFPGYNPFNQPKKEEQIEIPKKVMDKARDVNATHISKDGQSCYKKLFGKVCQADYTDGHFGSWWEPPIEDIPKDAIECKS